LAFIGLIDLTAASLNEETSLEYWLSNVPVRLVFLFSLTGYIYLFKEDGLLGSSAIRQEGAGDMVRNSMVFAWAFMETAAWFWVSTRSHPRFWSLPVANVMLDIHQPS